MKILVIGAGASWSTKDVEDGVVDGLRQAGADVGRYALDARLAASGAYLEWFYRRAKKHHASYPKPTANDVQLHALGEVVTRALANRVEWAVLVSAMFVPKAFVEVLQRAGLFVAIVMTESPYDVERELAWAEHADLVWTNERSCVDAFAAVTRARYLPHAVRSSVHRPHGQDADTPAHDVVFVGSCFDEREELLSAIDWTGIDVALYGNWRRLSRRSPLKAFVREGVIDNTKTAALYRRAKVGLNLYRESKGWAKGALRIAHAESLNPRAYELAACGCVHVSQYRAEVLERFGGLVPTFSTASEAEGQIRGLLADEARRARIAAALPACVARETWTARGRAMLTDLSVTEPDARARVLRQWEIEAVPA